MESTQHNTWRKNSTCMAYLMNLTKDFKPQSGEQTSKHCLYWHHKEEDSHSRETRRADRIQQQYYHNRCLQGADPQKVQV